MVNKDGIYDKLDFRILKELKENARESYRLLADRLGVHVNTLMQRIKKLEKEKLIIKYSVEIDYRKLGYDLHAIVMLKTKKGVVGDITMVKDIANIPQIQVLYAVTGTADVIALVRVKDRDELSDVLKRIQENNIVSRSNTMVVLHTYKHSYDYNPLADMIAMK